MSKFHMIIIDRKKIGIGLSLLALIIIIALYGSKQLLSASPTAAPTGSKTTTARTIPIVTGEYKTMHEGKEIKAYQWSPATIPVKKGERITLQINGVNGASHPFVIEGLNLQGEVRKGEQTNVTFDALEEGIYRIVCTVHVDMDHHGPMVGYIVVD